MLQWKSCSMLLCTYIRVMYSHLQQLAVSRLCIMYNVQCTYYDLFNVAMKIPLHVYSIYSVHIYSSHVLSFRAAAAVSRLCIMYILCGGSSPYPHSIIWTDSSGFFFFSFSGTNFSNLIVNCTLVIIQINGRCRRSSLSKHSIIFTDSRKCQTLDIHLSISFSLSLTSDGI